VKKPNTVGCTVYHRDIFGLRKEKYQWLDENQLNIQDYEKLTPVTPWYFFIKKKHKGDRALYRSMDEHPDIFPINSTGIKTHRDDFVIAYCETTRIIDQV